MSNGSGNDGIPRTWIVVDVSSLAYRLYYAMGDLRFEGISTGMAYGFFRSLVDYNHRFSNASFAFCFDLGQPKRRILYLDYKSGRGEMTDEERAGRLALHGEIDSLRNDYLPAIGFRNLFGREGFEADDLVASVVHHTPKSDRCVIVSTDSDLYQLISHRVDYYSLATKRILTYEAFTDQWGISPWQWPDVKALAGCRTDNVPGVVGVGERTAIKFLSGRMKSGKIFDRITKSHELWERNLKLVRLPYRGTPRARPVPDRIDRQSWRRVMRRLGIASLREVGW